MKTTNKLMTLGLIAGFALIASPVLAQTYTYVNTSGQLKTINANTATAAITLATDIAPHSGVIAGGTTVVETNPTTPAVVVPNTGSGDNLYAYVNIYGTLSYALADNATQAISFATDIKAHSGVMLVAR